jgi:hypothetical protein
MLKRWGRSAVYMCSPAANLGAEPRPDDRPRLGPLQREVRRGSPIGARGLCASHATGVPVRWPRRTGRVDSSTQFNGSGTVTTMPSAKAMPNGTIFQGDERP